LYDPANEHDACGIAFVAELRRGPSHAVVDLALTALENLAHRGAFGSDAETGDGAGILLQMPDRLFRAAAGELGIELPPPGQYGSGLAFLPRDPREAADARAEVCLLAEEEGLAVLGWREVPARLEVAGEGARRVAPSFTQIFVGWRPGATAGKTCTPAALERRLFVLRKRAEHGREGLYFPSLSARTFVYKGMLATDQLRGFFPDLTDDRMESAIALVHSRFSTNTFPAWPLAHPSRLVTPTARINTLKGTRTWWRRASPSSPPASSRGTSSGSSPSSHRAPATRPPLTRFSSCSTSQDARFRTPS